MRYTINLDFFFCRDDLMQDAVKFQSWEFLETHFGDQKSQWEMKRENANHDSPYQWNIERQENW